MPTSINERILAKSCGAGSLRVQWSQASSLLRSAGASWEEVAFFVDGFLRPGSLDALARNWRRGVTPPLSLRIVADVDESSYPLSDWLAALEAVFAFLARSRRPFDPVATLGYVNCAAEYGSSREAGLALAGIVEEMLGEFGYDG